MRGPMALDAVWEGRRQWCVVPWHWMQYGRAGGTMRGPMALDAVGGQEAVVCGPVVQYTSCHSQAKRSKTTSS
jgi:hypothetical protein